MNWLLFFIIYFVISFVLLCITVISDYKNLIKDFNIESLFWIILFFPIILLSFPLFILFMIAVIYEIEKSRIEVEKAEEEEIKRTGKLEMGILAVDLTEIDMSKRFRRINW